MGLGCNVEKSRSEMYCTSRLHARQAEGRASAGQGGVDGCSNRSCGLRDCPSAGRSARGCSSRRAVLHTAKSLPRRHCSLRPAPAAARRACGNSYTAGSGCLAWAAPRGRQQPPPVHPKEGSAHDGFIKRLKQRRPVAFLFKQGSMASFVLTFLKEGDGQEGF